MVQISKMRHVAHTLNANIGINEFHNLIAVNTKIQICKTENKYMQYRS